MPMNIMYMYVRRDISMSIQRQMANVQFRVSCMYVCMYTKALWILNLKGGDQEGKKERRKGTNDTAERRAQSAEP